MRKYVLILLTLFVTRELIAQKKCESLSVNAKLIEQVRNQYFEENQDFWVFELCDNSIEQQYGPFNCIRIDSTCQLNSDSVRLVLICMGDQYDEAEFMFVELVNPINSNVINVPISFDIKTDILRTIEFEIKFGIVTYESETNFEPY